MRIDAIRLRPIVCAGRVACARSFLTRSRIGSLKAAQERRQRESRTRGCRSQIQSLCLPVGPPSFVSAGHRFLATHWLTEALLDRRIPLSGDYVSVTAGTGDRVYVKLHSVQAAKQRVRIVFVPILS